MLLRLLFADPATFFAWAIAFVLAITVHEFSHAFVSYRLGDPLAKMEGRLSLNPLAHLDPIGTVLLLVVGFGWGKPVPFDPYALKHPRWGALLIALGGPISNFLMAVVAGILFRVLALAGVANPLVFNLLAIIVVLNVGLMLFNLLPIPPLDGSKLLPVLLPSRMAGWVEQIERLGPLLLFGLIVLDNLVGYSIFTHLYNFGLDLASRILGQ